MAKLSENMRGLIQNIVTLPEFWKINYYMRSMKKALHGGIFTNRYPNVFLKYYTAPAYLFFTPHAEFPTPALDICDKLSTLIDSSNVGDEELLCYCLNVDKEHHENPQNGSRIYIATCGKVITSKKSSETDHEMLAYSAVEGEINYLDNFDIDRKRLMLLFAFTLVECFVHRIYDINEILRYEILRLHNDKYGLCDITGAKFERQGFILDEKYYLYNIFLDTSIKSPIANVPRSVELILKIEPQVQIFMRCDENLAVPYSQRVSTATVDFEKWRGITFSFENIKNQIKSGKETIVHFDPQTLHKILFYIKRATDENGLEFYHMNVEQLWNPDIFEEFEEFEDIIITNYIHGTYYPTLESFDHIDFSVNQYDRDVFEAKYSDAEQITGISIGEYSDIHYKIWCIRGDNLTSLVWADLVCASLDEPFRKIFMETIGGTYTED